MIHCSTILFSPDQPMTYTSSVHTILGEEFDTDELRDIARYGAHTGVHGFTYSSDLSDMYDKFEDVITDFIDCLGFTLGEIFTDQEFDTLQEFKEWACWSYLEGEALRITDI